LEEWEVLSNGLDKGPLAEDIKEIVCYDALYEATVADPLSIEEIS
jgi:hypothetical protein